MEDQDFARVRGFCRFKMSTRTFLRDPVFYTAKIYILKQCPTERIYSAGPEHAFKKYHFLADLDSETHCNFYSNATGSVGFHGFGGF